MTTLAYDIIARDRASSTFSKIGRAAGLLGGALGAVGLARFLKDSVNVEAQFSQTMASVQVNAEASGKSMESLSQLAIQLGQDTVYSANEAAAAMLDLSKGGMTAAQIQGGALAASLNLAATEGINLDTSATIVAQSLKMFGLEAGDSAKAVDMLAGGSLASTASVEGLAGGLKYVGATAHSMNYSMSETVTALSALTDAGIDGTTAGTSLNRMLLGLSLTTPKARDTAKDLGLTFSDAKGNMLPMVDIVKKLNATFADMSTTERTKNLKAIFGVEGMRAANILLGQGVEGWDKYRKAVDKSGQAQKMADARMSGTAGAMEQLSGSIETAQLVLGQKMAPVVQDVANYLAENMVPAMDKAIEAGDGLVDMVKPALPLLEGLGIMAKEAAGFIDGLPGPVKKVGAEVLIAAYAFPYLTRQFDSASVKLKTLAADMKNAETRTAMLGKVARGAAGIGGMMLLAHGVDETNSKLGTMESIAGGALTGFAAGGPWGAAIGAGAGLLAGLATQTGKAADAAREAQPDFEGLAASLDQVTGATTRATKAQIFDDLTRSGSLKILQEYGVNSRTAVAAVMGNKKALQDVYGVQARVNQQVQQNNALIDEKTARIEELNSGLDGMTEAEYQESLALQGGIKALKDKNKHLRNGAALIDDEVAGLKASQKATRDKAKAVADLSSLQGKMPKKVVTAIEQTGVEPTVRGIARVVDQQGLVKPQIKALIEAVGVDTTVREVQKVVAAQQKIDRNIDIWIRTHRFTTGNEETTVQGFKGNRSGGAGAAPRSAPRTSSPRSALTPRTSYSAGVSADDIRMALEGMTLTLVGADGAQKAILSSPGILVSG